jgi:endonuclease YncB( thermonuclease family)
MAKKFRMGRRRGLISSRFLFNAAFVAVLITVLFGSYHNQFGELFAPLAPKAKPPSVVYAGASAPAGPSVIKPGAIPASASSGPKVIELNSTTGSVPNKPKLPTIVKLGPAPDSVPSASITGSIQSGRIEVVDGDTIRADGQSYRLVGLDAPESGEKAKCAAEREIAARANLRLREIVAGGGLKLDRVSCDCAAGTEGTPACNYGRLCGVLTVSGRDVSLTLIGEGLAKRYDCVAGRCPPKQPWC